MKSNKSKIVSSVQEFYLGALSQTTWRRKDVSALQTIGGELLTIFS